MTTGVPRGFILGPILLQIFVNDLQEYVNDSRVSMFSDDTAIYYTAHDREELQLTVQDDLPSISQWLNWRTLTVNVKKTSLCS